MFGGLLLEKDGLMKVKIKDFGIDPEVKTKGLEFAVSDNDGKHIGDCYVTKTGLIWCVGKTTKKMGKRISWDDFAALMAKRP